MESKSLNLLAIVFYRGTTMNRQQLIAEMQKMGIEIKDGKVKKSDIEAALSEGLDAGRKTEKEKIINHLRSDVVSENDVTIWDILFDDFQQFINDLGYKLRKKSDDYAFSKGNKTITLYEIDKEESKDGALLILGPADPSTEEFEISYSWKRYDGEIEIEAPQLVSYLKKFLM